MKKRLAFVSVVFCIGILPMCLGAQQTSARGSVTPSKVSALAPGEQIQNLDGLKDQLKQYHECTCTCGCYAKDLDLQADRAIAFLRLRAAHRRPQERLALVLDIDETTLSNYPEMVKADFECQGVCRMGELGLGSGHTGDAAALPGGAEVGGERFLPHRQGGIASIRYGAESPQSGIRRLAAIDSAPKRAGFFDSARIQVRCQSDDHGAGLPDCAQRRGSMERPERQSRSRVFGEVSRPLLLRQVKTPGAGVCRRQLQSMVVRRCTMGRMKKLGLLSLVLFLSAPAWAADKLSAPELTALAKAHSPELRAAIEGSFDAKDLQEGTAWAGHGPDFFFAVEAASAPLLVIDDAARPAMEKIAGAILWYAAAHIEPVGRLHQFHYLVDGAKFGGRLDMPAFGPLSYLQPGVPTGKLSEKIIHTSKIYDG